MINPPSSNAHAPLSAHDPRTFLPHVRRARQLQGEAIGDILGAVARCLARCLSRGQRRIVCGIKQRRATAELSRLDDHLLADIGIRRAHIMLIAQGLLTPPEVTLRHHIRTVSCPPEYRRDAANEAKTISTAA